MAKLSKSKLSGLVLCLGAVVILTAGWTWAQSLESRSTDNAYIRGDVTSIASKVGGYVTDLEVEDNQVVQAGDILFRIDDRDYSAKLSQAVADVKTAEALLVNVDAETKLQAALIDQATAGRAAALAQLKLTKITSERGHKLVRTNVIGQEEVDERDAALAKAEANVAAASAVREAETRRIAVLTTRREAASAALAHAQAALELAQIDFNDTVIRAPVDGIVGNRQIRIGRLVAPGTPMLDIVPVNNVWVVANFKESQLEHIRPGQRALVTVDGYPNETIVGTVDSLSPGSGSAFAMLPTDNATGNFVRVVQRVPVKIRFTRNPLPGLIVPGLSARVEIDLDSGS